MSWPPGPKVKTCANPTLCWAAVCALQYAAAVRAHKFEVAQRIELGGRCLLRSGSTWGSSRPNKSARCYLCVSCLLGGGTDRPTLTRSLFLAPAAKWSGRPFQTEPAPNVSPDCHSQGTRGGGPGGRRPKWVMIPQQPNFLSKERPAKGVTVWPLPPHTNAKVNMFCVCWPPSEARATSAGFGGTKTATNDYHYYHVYYQSASASSRRSKPSVPQVPLRFTRASHGTSRTPIALCHGKLPPARTLCCPTCCAMILPLP